MFKSIIAPAIVDMFFPPICPLCRVNWVEKTPAAIEMPGYCIVCKDKLTCLYENYCPKCGLPVGKEANVADCKTCRGRTIHYDHLVFVNEYKTYIGELILNFKYRNDKLLAYFFGKWMQEKVKLQNWDFEVIIPVPMHWRKKIKRGYNQAEMLGFEISKNLKKPLKTNILKRSKLGETQAGQSRTVRYKGVKNLYYINKSHVYKKILLVDDVATTGSTLSECAKLLKDSGCEKVYCVTIAGVHRDK